MTDWTQHHQTQTQTMTGPDGHEHDIDKGVAGLVAELWRRGFITKLACEDAGEAILNGGTLASPEEIESAAARNIGRAWLIVEKDDGPKLFDIWKALRGDWLIFPVQKDSQPDRWISITFPKNQIPDAVELLAAQ
jgi:hypothetical protein